MPVSGVSKAREFYPRCKVFSSTEVGTESTTMLLS